MRNPKTKQPKFGVDTSSPLKNRRQKMNSAQPLKNEPVKISVHRDQILEAVAAHLTGLGLAYNKEIVELEIFGMPKTELIPITYKTQEVPARQTSPS
jgi:hypothetical protein